MNFGLSAAAVSGWAGARGWIEDGPGRCVIILLLSGALAESWLAPCFLGNATCLGGHWESLMAQEQIVHL